MCLLWWINATNIYILSKLWSKKEKLMCCENNNLNERLSESLLECEKHAKDLENDLQTWTDSLSELSEIEDAFKTDGKFKLRGKTVLDIGTDCVKPLYIALKFKPDKIIGINEDLSIYSFEADLKQKSKLFIQTEIGLYSCSFFDNETFERIKMKESMSKKRFDFVLVSKTLHHLRSGKCVAKERDEKHQCQKDESCCIYEFEEQTIFEKLLELGERVIIYEYFDPSDTDNDKIRGRGGYFIIDEWKRILSYLTENYEVRFIRPRKFQLHRTELADDIPILRQVDCICFYVEKTIGK
jgi:hypothetical protein